jgi:AraC-like DNA-binding protein
VARSPITRRGAYRIDMRRQTRGLKPVCRVKTRLKWLWSAKPQAKAISENISEVITLEGLAAIAGYSAFHFARKFTLAMAVSPGRYISQRRWENAMAELAAGRLSVAEIALNAQFSSQASFTRAFHRATGTTPKEYQRRRR